MGFHGGAAPVDTMFLYCFSTLSTRNWQYITIVIFCHTHHLETSKSTGAICFSWFLQISLLVKSTCLIFGRSAFCFKNNLLAWHRLAKTCEEQHATYFTSHWFYCRGWLIHKKMFRFSNKKHFKLFNLHIKLTYSTMHISCYRLNSKWRKIWHKCTLSKFYFVMVQ